jgi:hypothetical protein
MSERITKMQALRAARARLPLRGDKAINENLSWFADSLAEAYRVGAAEAQQEIVRRIASIKGRRS